MSFWASLHQVTRQIASWTLPIMWSASFFASLFYTFYLCFRDNNNWRLRLILGLMMVVAVSSSLITILNGQGHYKLAVISSALLISFDTYVHWMFCYIYLKLQIEVKYLLDSRIYMGNQEIILKCNRENFCLEVANILNALISLGFLII